MPLPILVVLVSVQFEGFRYPVVHVQHGIKVDGGLLGQGL